MSKHSIKGEREKKKKANKDMNLEESFLTMFAELMINNTSAMTYSRRMGAAGLTYKCIFRISEIIDEEGNLIKPEELSTKIAEIKAKREEQKQTK